jgi:hypothetical protein
MKVEVSIRWLGEIVDELVSIKDLTKDKATLYKLNDLINHIVGKFNLIKD